MLKAFSHLIQLRQAGQETGELTVSKLRSLQPIIGTLLGQRRGGQAVYGAGRRRVSEGELGAQLRRRGHGILSGGRQYHQLLRQSSSSHLNPLGELMPGGLHIRVVDDWWR